MSRSATRPRLPACWWPSAGSPRWRHSSSCPARLRVTAATATPTPFSVADQQLAFVGGGAENLPSTRRRSTACVPRRTRLRVGRRDYQRPHRPANGTKPRNVALSPSGRQLVVVGGDVGRDVFAVVLLPSNDNLGSNPVPPTERSAQLAGGSGSRPAAPAVVPRRDGRTAIAVAAVSRRQRLDPPNLGGRPRPPAPRHPSSHRRPPWPADSPGHPGRCPERGRAAGVVGRWLHARLQRHARRR